MPASSQYGFAAAALDGPMAPRARRLARIAGVLLIITFVTSIPALLLYDPALNDAGYVLGAGADTRIQLGAFLEVLLVMANIGTALELLLTIPEIVWEAALGIYLTVKGFKASPGLFGEIRHAGVDEAALTHA